MKFIKLALTASALVISTSINASSILVAHGFSGAEPDNGYGGNSWVNMTNALDAAGSSVDVAEDFSDLSQMLNYDALWLSTRRSSNVLSEIEINNITSFIATGRRVVLNGENGYWWGDWNDSILATVGGSSIRYESDTHRQNTVVSNSLTDGVNAIQLGTGGIAIGGTALFESNSITLWGESNNVVSMLDVNLCADNYWDYVDNAQFCGNLASWTASSVSAVPVPAAVWLFGSGLIGLMGVARRKT